MRAHVCFWLILASALSAAAAEIRQPAVAGQFYPADPVRLTRAIEAYLKDAVPRAPEPPVALIVPHAGYIFSGQIAADAFRQVEDRDIEVVVILGANHVPPGIRGISIWSKGGFRTPLGTALVDEELAAALLAADSDCTSEVASQLEEHSVEVQVPWVQYLLPRAKILPVVIGRPDIEMCRHFGRSLARALGGRRALIAASSDLSHYPSYADAARADRETLLAAARLDEEAFAQHCRRVRGTSPNLETGACGEAPVLAAIAAARALGANRGVVLSYANSGDTAAGGRDRVVGYGAVSMTRGGGPQEYPARPRPDAEPLCKADREALLRFARTSIQRYLETETAPLARGFPARLERPSGAFVTLRKGGQLRGCLGHFAADTPTCQIVGKMALHSAFNDARFLPLTAAEFPAVEIEISLLTEPRPIRDIQQIRLGRDGVILQKDGRSATFLPQVATEFGWGLDEFLDQLCRKAGLQAGCSRRGARLQVYQAEVFSDPDLR